MFPTGWGRKCAITIQASQVGANLSNFPVLFTKDNLPSEMFNADGLYPALNGGGDIRFSSDADGNNQLACEIVTFVTDNDPNNGNAEIWVKVPSISSSTDTVIYVWYNKSGETQPAASDTYGSQNVWDIDYVARYHLSEASGNRNDSTANANNLGVTGTVAQVDSKVGKGTETSAGAQNELRTLTSDIGTDLGSSLTSFSYGVWFKADIVTDNDGILYLGPIANSHGEAYINVQSSKIYVRIDGINFNQSFAFTDTANWHHLFLVYNGSNVYVYLDGVVKLNGIVFSNSLDFSGLYLFLHSYYGAASWTFDGKIDEVSISKSARSVSWYNTEYNNQNSPSTFAIEGTPESPGSGGTGVTVTPSVESITLSSPSPTVSTGQGAIVIPTAESINLNSPAVSVFTGSKITPSAESIVFSEQSPTISTGGSALVQVVAESITFSTPAPSVKIGTNVAVAAESITFSTPTVSISVSSSITVAVQAEVITFNIPVPTIIAGRAALVSVDPEYIYFSIPEPTVIFIETISGKNYTLRLPKRDSILKLPRRNFTLRTKF